jgi:hypothetical protein
MINENSGTPWEWIVNNEKPTPNDLGMVLDMVEKMPWDCIYSKIDVVNCASQWYTEDEIESIFIKYKLQVYVLDKQ